MRLLALDTATEACTVGLDIDGRILERFEQRSQHSEHLLPMIDALLAEAGVSLRQLDAIAFGRGPGSFTGLRIGAGVAQGLAFGADLPVVPVSSLAILAQGQAGARILAAFDARMRQVYWGAYRRGPAGLVELDGAEAVLAPEAVPIPAEGGWIGAGPGWDAHGEALAVRLADRLAARRRQQYPHARDLLVLAAAALHAGGGCAAEQALPVYVRDEVAARTRG